MEARDVPETPPSRRDVLRRAAAAGALGVATPLVAACGSEEPAAAPAPEGSEATGDGALGSTDQVPVGGGKVFPDRQVVVTQPMKGEFKAYSAICTHQGCTVGSVGNGTINCPCHGSRFDIETGRPVSGPATAPLPAKDVRVRGGEITLT